VVYASFLVIVEAGLLFAGLLFGFTAVGISLLIVIGVLLLVGPVLSTYGRWKDRRRIKARELLHVWFGPNAQIPRMGRRRICRLYKAASYRHAFSPDRRYLAADVNDEHVHIWDLDELRFICCVEAKDQVLSIEFSPRGRCFAVGTADMILIVDAPTGKQLRALNAKDEWPAEMKFSPDGRYLASTNDDYGPLVLREVETGSWLWAARDHEGFADLEFSPDSQQLIAIGNPYGGSKRTILRWHLDGGRVIPLAPL